ncbi:uncharacterized protein LOC123534394 [Mercenaria mercenaria]|uniref:uncharacterized protein LOC123534394 n=1 Tax=Mercenaria mercenaria TaxID=6596 RepID=UPI00234EB6FB|nr:uncharacterized protein LOC123534394 [Mercenaria mercenaria]
MIGEIAVLFFTIHSTAADSTSNEGGCFYLDVSERYAECVRVNSYRSSLNKVMKDFMETDFTGEVLLSKLESTCRNEQLFNTYSNCTRRAILECPHLSTVITNAVNEGLAVFCQNNAPSAWLYTVLQDGYLHTQRCTEDRIDNEILDMVIECAPNFRRDWTGVTVHSAITTLQTMIQQLVRCMIDNGPSLPDQDGDGVLDCGSSWQDIVLAYSLRLSSLDDLGWKIGEEEINALQAIKTG